MEHAKQYRRTELAGSLFGGISENCAPRFHRDSKSVARVNLRQLSFLPAARKELPDHSPLEPTTTNLLLYSASNDLIKCNRQDMTGDAWVSPISRTCVSAALQLGSNPNKGTNDIIVGMCRVRTTFIEISRPKNVVQPSPESSIILASKHSRAAALPHLHLANPLHLHSAFSFAIYSTYFRIFPADSWVDSNPLVTAWPFCRPQDGKKLG